MKTARKTISKRFSDASLKKDRQSHANATDSGRHIKTTYYTTPERTHCTLNTRSIHMRTTVPNVIKNMQENRHDSLWAEVWNDETGQLIATVRRNVVGDVNTTLYIDPVTGKKLREQPWKTKAFRTTLGNETVEMLDDFISKLIMLDIHPATSVFYRNGVADLSAIRSSPVAEDYRQMCQEIASFIRKQLLTDPINGEQIEERTEYIRKASSYVFTQSPVERRHGSCTIKTGHGLLTLAAHGKL